MLYKIIILNTKRPYNRFEEIYCVSFLLQMFFAEKIPFSVRFSSYDKKFNKSIFLIIFPI